jgi:mannose-6-phosphate isomerase
MSQLYPLKFKTIFKEKIWGGHKVKSVLQKDFSPQKNCGETWEISGVAGSVSVVDNGPLAGRSLPDLIAEYTSDLVGPQVYRQYQNDFPLLVKFLDASEDLSIQVHPNDELAQSRHQSLGKTEMWYIIQADAGAKLITGFNRAVTKEEYLQLVAENRLDEILNQEDARADDVFFIPAGRVHTIGKGLLLAEIQQSSDITYRIYDFDRTDEQGNKRELHTKQALDAIDYEHYPTYKTTYTPQKNAVVQLVKAPYFTTNLLDLDQPFTRNYQDLDSFEILICLQGGAVLFYGEQEMPLKTGDCLLVPAALPEIILKPAPTCKILESFV